MQIKIGDQTIEVSIDYYEPASAGSWDEPPSPEHIEWSATCPVVDALLDKSEQLREIIDELVYEQAKKERAESAADAAYERWANMQEAM